MHPIKDKRARLRGREPGFVIDSDGTPGTKFIYPLKICAFGTASCREPGKREISEAEARFQESGAGAVGARATVPAINWEDDMKRLCIFAPA